MKDWAHIRLHIPVTLSYNGKGQELSFAGDSNDKRNMSAPSGRKRQKKSQQKNLDHFCHKEIAHRRYVSSYKWCKISNTRLALCSSVFVPRTVCQEPGSRPICPRLQSSSADSFKSPLLCDGNWKAMCLMSTQYPSRSACMLYAVRRICSIWGRPENKEDLCSPTESAIPINQWPTSSVQ